MYLIPKNVNARMEFFTGFGFRELFITGIGLGIGILFFYIFGIFTHSMKRIMFIALCGGIGLYTSLPDKRTGKSLLHLLQDYKTYNLHPRRYFYVFGSGRKEKNK